MAQKQSRIKVQVKVIPCKIVVVVKLGDTIAGSDVLIGPLPQEMLSKLFTFTIYYLLFTFGQLTIYYLLFTFRQLTHHTKLVENMEIALSCILEKLYFQNQVSSCVKINMKKKKNGHLTDDSAFLQEKV